MKDRKQEPSNGSSIYDSIASTMNVDIVVNESADVWVLHDQPLPGILNWAELDVETKKLTFMCYEGKLLELGMFIHPPIMDYVKQASQIQVAQMRDKKIYDVYKLPLLVTDHSAN